MNKGICILCDRSTGRNHNPNRPCCARCEKTAAMVIQAPGLFIPGPIEFVAQTAIDKSNAKVGES